MSCDFTNLKCKLYKLNIKLTNKMEEQFTLYYETLIEWNKVMNLTAITEFDDVVDKHFLDSAALGFDIQMRSILNRNMKMIDIGTGAGFPGIPLKILFPELQIVLVDSLNKRVKFLNEVIEKLELHQITSIHARAEELAHKEEYREQFDMCVSRAVANLSSLCEYCMPFVKIGGLFVSYKSADIDLEVKQSEKAIQILGGKLNEVKKFCLPDTEYQRSFVVINKVKRTSKKYPRKAGVPSKMPL